MASHHDLRKIAKRRLKAAKILMDAGDWDSSAYMLGLTLECALKAVACKTLKLLAYPENTKKKEIDNYFMTHRFDQLLLVSGMQQVFSLSGPADSFKNWSDFTVEYPGELLRATIPDSSLTLMNKWLTLIQDSRCYKKHRITTLSRLITS